MEDAKREFAWINVQIQIRRENFDSFAGPLYVIFCPFFKSTMTNEKFFRKYQKIPYHCTCDSLVDARDLKSEVAIVPPIRYFGRNTQNATKLKIPHPGNFRIAPLAIGRPCVNTCPELSTTDVTPRIVSSPTSLRMNTEPSPELPYTAVFRLGLNRYNCRNGPAHGDVNPNIIVSSEE